MIRNLNFEEDLALKRLVTTPRDAKPRFTWHEVLTEPAPITGEVLVTCGREERHFNLADVADEIGEALTNLLLSREENDIFTEQNRGFVANVAHSVATMLLDQVREGRSLKLSENDLSLLIEKALIENDAHDVAKSLVFGRSARNGTIEVVPSEEVPLSVRLIRRNGTVVPWNESKIETACRKAFLSIKEDATAAQSIAAAVTDRIRREEQAFVHIEDVQDWVQEELMRQGYYKAAESYILYRAHRSRLREEAIETGEDDSGQQQSLVVVKTRSGENVFWDGSELKKRITFASIGLDLCLNSHEIERELRRSVSAEISEDGLKNTIILNAKSLIERDADFAKFAARILLSYIYEEVLDWQIARDGIEGLKEAHRVAFKSYLRHGVAIERLSPKLLSYDLDKLADTLDPSADLDFDYLGIQTLYDRYLIVDKTRQKTPRRIETPQFFWMRVSMGLFIEEPKDREDWIARLYSLYKNRRFCSSTPTLFNSGTPHSQLSSCYLYKVDDSIESIMSRGIAENAYLSKWAGGLGGSWTSVRGTGSYIKGTNGESQGVIPFLKLHNDQLVAVNQGGKRRGSGCAYLETWHNDIEDFLQLRKNVGDERRRTHDMNTANWIPDLFMKRMETRGTWTLFRTNEVPDLHDSYGKKFEERYEHYEQEAVEGKIWSRQIPALDLWKAMLKMIFETGHPWITFKDPCNLRSPQDHAGVIHSSNLCTEITLNTCEDETAVCNLGSVVLDTHIRSDGELDLEMLRETITVAVRALDNVIDINFYPTEAAKRSNLRHRPIGLGVMGLQNALFKKDISFASEEAVDFNDEFMEAISYFAFSASSDLAAERGMYSSYHGSKWERGILPHDTIEMLEKERGIPVEVPRGEKMDWAPVREKIRTQGMRNSNVLAIAPTATISNIMGTTPCIEPNYKNLYVKSNLSGEFIVLNCELVRDLKNEGLWSPEMVDQLKYFDGELRDIDSIPEPIKRKHLTVFSVDYRFIISAAARRQKWIDQSQSVNLFLANPDLKTLSHMYRAAWRSGLKTTYYLRTLGASNIEKATLAVDKTKRGLVGVKLEPTEEEKAACSLEARRRGEECESCQ